VDLSLSLAQQERSGIVLVVGREVVTDRNPSGVPASMTVVARAAHIVPYWDAEVVDTSPVQGRFHVRVSVRQLQDFRLALFHATRYFRQRPPSARL
jgi:hypothetical protein